MKTDVNNIPQPNTPVEPQPSVSANPQLNPELNPVQDREGSQRDPVSFGAHPHFNPIIILIILGVLIVGYFASAKYAL